MADYGLRHLSIGTRDLDGAVEFYTRVLGLEVAFRVPPRRVFLRWPGEGDLLDLVGTRARIPRGGGLEHFGFKVPRSELKRIEKRLREAHVEIEGRRGRGSIYFRDRDGYLVECYCDGAAADDERAPWSGTTSRSSFRPKRSAGSLRRRSS